ncbi:MAG TPA: hypothetical protein ENN23_07225 [Deltaproteobacteria bacterium]|nr:hypothetical protein [Deltaproteobacteria bacterium]
MLRSFKSKGIVILLFIMGGVLLCCSQVKVIPEMKELIDKFPNCVQRTAVLEKYSEPGIVPVELRMCDMTKPIIKKVEEREGITYYTLESRVEKCLHSEMAAGTVRLFDMGWQDQKLVKFAWGGPKSGKVEY